ncbi:MAG: hypothetical protein M5U01_23620 [Ardenticatenaceae bacterium]|nr:hypothetical protein [Ardenticatenaceae bacterium]HBY98968.1 hypothetical protein [Chloroflexota bacterium]
MQSTAHDRAAQQALAPAAALLGFGVAGEARAVRRLSTTAGRMAVPEEFVANRAHALIPRRETLKLAEWCGIVVGLLVVTAFQRKQFE